MEIKQKTQPIRSVLFRETSLPPLFIWLNNDMAWYPNPLWQINVMFSLCQRKVTHTHTHTLVQRSVTTAWDSHEVLMKVKSLQRERERVNTQHTHYSLLSFCTYVNDTFFFSFSFFFALWFLVWWRGSEGAWMCQKFQRAAARVSRKSTLSLEKCHGRDARLAPQRA